MASTAKLTFLRCFRWFSRLLRNLIGRTDSSVLSIKSALACECEMVKSREMDWGQVTLAGNPIPDSGFSQNSPETVSLPKEPHCRLREQSDMLCFRPKSRRMGNEAICSLINAYSFIHKYRLRALHKRYKNLCAPTTLPSNRHVDFFSLPGYPHFHVVACEVFGVNRRGDGIGGLERVVRSQNSGPDACARRLALDDERSHSGGQAAQETGQTG